MSTARLEFTTNELYNLSIFTYMWIEYYMSLWHFKDNTVICEIFFLIDFSILKILWISPYLHSQRLALPIFNYQWVLPVPAFLFPMISFAHLYFAIHWNAWSWFLNGVEEFRLNKFYSIVSAIFLRVYKCIAGILWSKSYSIHADQSDEWKL